jgi:coenzyme F420 hydrogenase subunit beta
VNASETREFGRPRNNDERWTGIIRRVYEVHATDPQILKHASAGGAVTALLVSALRSGLIDAALVVGHDESQPWRSRAILTNDEGRIVRSAAAKYTFAPNLPLLDDTPFHRIGVVGLPCEIEAIHKMRSLDPVPEPARRVAFTIELACASATLPDGTRHVIEERMGIDSGEVTDLRYRGGDYPGDFTVRTRDSGEHRYPFFQMVKDFTRFKTFRCDACPDWWSGLADISVADGDPNIFALSQRGDTARPRSTVVVRTAAGERILADAIVHRMIHAAETEFDPAQSLGLQRKRHRYTRIASQSVRVIPSPPATDVTAGRPMSDEEVISEMSQPKPGEQHG